MSAHEVQPNRSRRSVHLVLLGMVAAFALIAGACGSSGGKEAEGGGQTDGTTAAETPVDGGSLVIGIGAETDGWNPSVNQWADAGNLVGSSVLEPLAEIGPDK